MLILILTTHPDRHQERIQTIGMPKEPAPTKE
ncbi:hypothetical protein HMPREF1015_01581 [Bacillus smithii 7_3_47FAA]|uniref:Uncharacterized protein n=1 Tax=Bacillus smithii 7_3_47FAA TaxID=665952 RepID=G9QK42_9BACI|nr:hypothetical protein HMPREF1015_01581 [Bacillus smithii 7_3_47FAA]